MEVYDTEQINMRPILETNSNSETHIVSVQLQTIKMSSLLLQLSHFFFPFIISWISIIVVKQMNTLSVIKLCTYFVHSAFPIPCLQIQWRL